MTGRAANKTFAVVEILERMLLNVDLYDLPHCQLVSKQFDGTMRGSVSIQRKLFKVPSKQYEYFDIRSTQPYMRGPVPHPGAVESLEYVQSDHPAIERDLLPPNQQYIAMCDLNPIILDLVQPLRLSGTSCETSSERCVACDLGFHVLGCSHIYAMVKLEQADLQGVMDMYITQPPASRADFFCAIEGPYPDEFEEELEQEGGIRVLDLVRAGRIIAQDRPAKLSIMIGRSQVWTKELYDELVAMPKGGIRCAGLKEEGKIDQTCDGETESCDEVTESPDEEAEDSGEEFVTWDEETETWN